VGFENKRRSSVRGWWGHSRAGLWNEFEGLNRAG
jgi:hypothetical protein